MSSIEWKHDGSRLLLTIAILPPTVHPIGWEQVTALVDTGATTSGVTGALAEQLGLPMVGKRPLSSVHGEQQVERYLFRVGFFTDPPAAVPFTFEETEGFRVREGFHFQALLGMDILSQCDLAISRRHDVSLTFGYT